MLKGIEGKRVYIFGAGDSLRIWIERYSQGLDVICAFDNSKSKWGTSAYGIPIRSPDELPALIDENSRLIVASVYRKEIGIQLDNMGIKDYFVFVDGWNYRKDSK
jgi:lipopolysaccharide cholinephosphotransferase